MSAPSQRSATSCSVLALIDIIIFATAMFGLGALFNRMLPTPEDARVRMLFNALGKVPVLLVVWGLLRLRRETSAAIGLKAPANWLRAIALGALVTGGIFVVIFFFERAGFHRDLSAFNFLRGNVELTIYQTFYVIVAAGFYEEVIYRGFLLQRIARAFGDNRVAWSIATVIQAAVFGYGHAYQNWHGIILTGTIGLLLSFVFLSRGRNLWPPIIAHALYDAARTIMFYYTGAR